MKPFSPLVGTQPCYVFHGHDIDAFVTVSKAESEKLAEDLNSDRQRYAVIKIFPDGTWDDVTEDYWRAPPDFVDEDELTVSRHKTWMREQSGAFR